nr:hypothetical protein Itr_chr13CG12050 [Ipomoea trifida]
MGKDPQGKGDSLIRSSSSKSSSSSYSSSSLSSSSYFASRVSLLDNTSAGYECCVACEELSNSSTFFRRSSGPRLISSNSIAVPESTARCQRDIILGLML